MSKPPFSKPTVVDSSSTGHSPSENRADDTGNAENAVPSRSSGQSRNCNELSSSVTNVTRTNPALCRDLWRKLDEGLSGPLHTKTYFIHCPATNRVKIGKATNVKDRLKSLATAASSKLVLLGVFDSDIETDLHRAHADDRICGEWFRFSAPVRRTIQKCIGIKVRASNPRNALPAMTLVLPPFALPRSQAESDWKHAAATFLSDHVHDFDAELLMGRLYVPTKFRPVEPCVTTYGEYEVARARFTPRPYDQDWFTDRYSETAFSIFDACIEDYEELCRRQLRKGGWRHLLALKRRIKGGERTTIYIEPDADDEDAVEVSPTLPRIAATLASPIAESGRA